MSKSLPEQLPQRKLSSVIKGQNPAKTRAYSAYFGSNQTDELLV